MTFEERNKMKAKLLERENTKAVSNTAILQSCNIVI